jgi:small-conductance mechanosensitive channel
MMRNIKPALDAAGIGIPFPQRDIRIINQTTDTPDK